MELLVAMFCGAAGGAMLRGTLGLIAATGLGIVAGAAAWYLLALAGPSLKAGPLVMMHAVSGAALGAAMVTAAALARRRLGR